MIAHAETPEGLQAMDWARGKRVVFIGDSCVALFLCHPPQADPLSTDTTASMSSTSANTTPPSELAFLSLTSTSRLTAEYPFVSYFSPCPLRPDHLLSTQSLDLTVASWFHYGLAPESDSLPADPNNPSSVGWNIPSLPTSRPNENPGPFAIEGRMREYWVPDTKTSVDQDGLGGKPDLIVLNSFFWVRPFPPAFFVYLT
jgi:hypothetical protein